MLCVEALPVCSGYMVRAVLPVVTVLRTLHVTRVATHAERNPLFTVSDTCIKPHVDVLLSGRLFKNNPLPWDE